MTVDAINDTKKGEQELRLLIFKLPMSSTPVTPSWPGLRTFMAIATFMTTTARIYVQTYAIYRLLSEITDDHLHVLLKYYYNVYLSYTSHNRPYHYHSRVQEINTHSALNSNFLIVVYCCK